MAHGSRLIDLIHDRIEEFLAERTSILRSVSDDLAPLDDYSRRFLSGGKRFRARFCYWGWHAAATDGPNQIADDAPKDLAPIIAAAASLELFHAAALIHDDLIDNSDTRRGAPSAHRLFERMHRDAQWTGDPDGFGRSSAILLGDLMLGWSDEMLDEGLDLLANRASARAARAEFVRMRAEVTAGQYLDVLEEHSWSAHEQSTHRTRAERVITYKSAKYSVEAPLLIGASLAGASEAALAALRAYGLPLGMAYQLRDDQLGVFGDPAVTGKPAGDDLREGKRTVLIATTRERVQRGARRVLDELLGDPNLSAEQISVLQRTILDSGAADELEERIAREAARARDSLEGAPLSRTAINELSALTYSVAERAS